MNFSTSCLLQFGFYKSKEYKTESQVKRLKQLFISNFESVHNKSIIHTRLEAVFSRDSNLTNSIVCLSICNSKISLIPKKGSLTSAKNWRPIVINCSMSKILEHVLNWQLQSFLQESRILSPTKHAYRKFLSYHMNFEWAGQIKIRITDCCWYWRDQFRTSFSYTLFSLIKTIQLTRCMYSLFQIILWQSY